MSRLRFAVTEVLIGEIILRVRSGAFPHVAAEAAGVPAEVFQEWMERGSRPGAREPYRGLAEQVRHAHGHARCVSEVALRQKDPKAWLLNRPGKNSDNLPGWTMPVKGQTKPQRPGAGVLLQAEMQTLLGSLLDVLAPYPEARAALAAALDKKKPAKQSGRSP